MQISEVHIVMMLKLSLVSSPLYKHNCGDTLSKANMIACSWHDTFRVFLKLHQWTCASLSVMSHISSLHAELRDV